MRKQNVIIFSSFKSLNIVKELCAELKKSDCVNAVNWEEYFKTVYPEEYRAQKSFPLFRFLTKRIPSFDFAVVVAGKDDMIPDNRKSSGDEKYRMRDNVIFELGMCCMALGEPRVILLHHKKVHLFADLRGNNSDLQKKLINNELHSTVLNTKNIQLTAFDFKFKKDIKATSLDIIKYIRKTADNYAPVIVGSACSLASGYSGNFIKAAVFAFDLYAHPNKEKGKANLVIPKHRELLDVCKNLANLEFHILLPNVNAYLRDPDIFANTKTACDRLYKDPRFGIIQDCSITDKGRKITFVCKVVGSKLFIIDMPTTILASYNTAQDILNINDNDPKNGEALRCVYMTKEIDMFNATLNRQNLSNLKIKCQIDDIFFDDEIDRKGIPWLYE